MEFNILQINTNCVSQMADSGAAKVGRDGVIDFEICKIEASCQNCLYNLISTKI